METIEFPQRTDKIKAITYTTPFPSNNGGMMQGISVEMENGDNFSHYATGLGELEGLSSGDVLTYVMKKVKEDGKVKNRAKTIYAGQPVKPKSRPLLSALDGMDIESLIFFDIETVRQDKILKVKTPVFESWAYKRRYEGETTATELKNSFEEKAALFPEFAKVACISMGMVVNGELVVQSYYGHDEREILKKFVSVLIGLQKKFPRMKLCGHTIIKFDIPFLYKRLLVNGLRVPNILDITYAKPWDLDANYLDIANVWNVTSIHRASLLNIATVFGVPSPKSNLDGSKVSDVYYQKKTGVKEVAKYCEEDVFATANITCHLFNTEKFTTFVSKEFKN